MRLNLLLVEMEAYSAILREDFDRFEVLHRGDWNALKTFQLSSDAINRLQALTAGEFLFNSEPPGLYHFQGVVQDMDSPEFFSAFSQHEDHINSFKYGLESEGKIVESQLLTRTLYRCLPFPGKLSLAPTLQTVQVALYDGQEMKIQSVLHALGRWDGTVLHIYQTLPPRQVSSRPEDRTEVLSAISAALGGDELAAEYVLMSLIAVVERREVMVGKLVVNITGMGSARELAEVVQQLSGVAMLPVSLNYLNHAKLTPKKNYENDLIEPSPVQLCDGTVLLLDETALEPGALAESGLANLQVLTTIINSQEINYDFTFHPLVFQVKFPCLIISRNKSILPNDVHLPVNLTHPISVFQLSQSAKDYVLTVRSGSVDISDDMQREITSSFVRKRKETQVAPEDLHRWITMAKLYAKSLGHGEMTGAHWEHVLALENQRLRRMESLPN